MTQTMQPERDTQKVSTCKIRAHAHARTHTHICLSLCTSERERGRGAVTDVEQGAQREEREVPEDSEDTYIVVGMRAHVGVAMRTHVERGADSEEHR
jgi:hypothetical protein